MFETLQRLERERLHHVIGRNLVAQPASGHGPVALVTTRKFLAHEAALRFICRVPTEGVAFLGVSFVVRAYVEHGCTPYSDGSLIPARQEWCRIAMDSALGFTAWLL